MTAALGVFITGTPSSPFRFWGFRCSCGHERIGLDTLAEAEAARSAHLCRDGAS